MRSVRFLHRLCVVVTFAATFAATAFGQVNLPAESIGGPLSAPRFRECRSRRTQPPSSTPSSAMARGSIRRRPIATTVTPPAACASKDTWRGWPPKTLAVRHFRTLIAPDPNRWPGVYTVDAEAGTVRLNPRSLISNTEGGGRSFDVPVGGVRFLSFFRAGDLLSADPGAFGDVRDEPLGMTRSASRGNRTTDHDHRPARLPWQRSVDRNGGRTRGIG